MNLFIQIENDQPKNHPALEDNLIQAFGSIPSNWEPFVRVVRPVVGVYQVLESEQPTYQKIDGDWTDVWSVRDMTAEEKAAKQQSVKDRWNSMTHSDQTANWVFNEDLCEFVPPKG